MAMQLCQEGYDADHIFGFIATSNGSFTHIQSALRTWVKADYLSFIKSKDIVVPAYFTTPPLGPTTKSTLSGTKKCGIADADIIEYNSASNVNSFTTGAVPDLKSKPSPDGSCYTHTFQAGDNCSSVAAANGLTNDDLENFNKKTWAWNGCSNVWVGTFACLSMGRPPFPPPIANAVCGPQVPGSKIPTDDSDIASLNPCPLNACCNFWGQCGTTEEFRENSAGNTAPGTKGCISNCGISIVSGTRDESFIRLGYFKGYNFSSPLYQNTLRVDASQYTHLHFAFGSITPGYEVNTGDTMTTHEFDNFKLLQCPKRILSFGSRSFSDDPEALTIITKAGVPSNKVVVSMLSYGRSFKMAETGCHTPDCLCTGRPQSSNAAKGVCAHTAGYIVNTGIEEILNDPARINQHYVDEASNSNILVYDNTQWVGYLSAEVKESRTALFKSLNMGGTADWAIDSEPYHNPNFLEKRRPGEDSYGVEKRTGK
ncbi:killer toxin subunits alpha/beta [Trichophyton mentagrophytes]|nr:killer toxin subunits alpha/beta [Trichophyton mentagrophytes]